MKRYFSSLLAIVIALSAVAFTKPATPKNDTVYDWLIYDSSGSSTGTFLEDKTEDQVRDANPNCNAPSTNCFQNYTQDHSTPLGLFIQKP